MLSGVTPLGHFIFGFIIFYKKIRDMGVEMSNDGIKKAGVVSNIFMVAIICLWVVFTICNVVPINETYFGSVAMLLQSCATLLEMFAATTTQKIQKEAVEKSTPTILNYLESKVNHGPPVNLSVTSDRD
jgi:hypothetical protein